MTDTPDPPPADKTTQHSKFTEYALLGVAVVLSPFLAYKTLGSGVAQSAERSTKALDDKVPQQQPPKPPGLR
jgi:hypothetical protein